MRKQHQMNLPFKTNMSPNLVFGWKLKKGCSFDALNEMSNERT